MRHTPPYIQNYRLKVSKEQQGARLLDFFCRRFEFKPQSYWHDLIQNGHITVNQHGVGPEYTLKSEDVIHTVRHDVVEPDVNADYEILSDRDGLFVVNKPSPLPVHPSGRYYKNTLITLLKERFPQRSFHTLHRLDTWTTGVLLLATDNNVARAVHRLVEAKKVKKAYAVVAVGEFGDRPFAVDEPVGRVVGAHRGCGPEITEAKEAKTLFYPIAKAKEMTLLKAVPVTGRTNQIRVHVRVAGGHVFNDPLYAPHHDPNLKFVGLHCVQMGFAGADGRDELFTAFWPEGFSRYFSREDWQACRI